MPIVLVNVSSSRSISACSFSGDRSTLSFLFSHLRVCCEYFFISLAFTFRNTKPFDRGGYPNNVFGITIKRNPSCDHFQKVKHLLVFLSKPIQFFIITRSKHFDVCILSSISAKTETVIVVQVRRIYFPIG